MEIVVTQIRQILIESDDAEDAIAKANSGQGKLIFSQDVPNAKQSGKPATVDEWPFWAKALKQLSTPQDKGIGDVVARIIGAETSEKFKAWHLVTFGRPCGCDGRQERWNRMYPL